jgi:membrane protein YqaA with SNARE-associated domain
MTAELVALFASAFLSATVLPGTSEAALVAVLASDAASPALAIAVATVGNTLGSVVNWAIGRFLGRYHGHPRFPIGKERFERTVAMYRRWGVWSLLLSWAPVIGDPLTVVAGVLRTNLPLFILLVGSAKLARYLAVLGFFSAASGS